jgi:hypothetical protein
MKRQVIKRIRTKIYLSRTQIFIDNPYYRTKIFAERKEDVLSCDQLRHECCIVRLLCPETFGFMAWVRK